MSNIWTSDLEPVEVGGTTVPALVASGGGGAALIDGESGVVS